MSRTTQFVGLSQEANNFLKEHDAKELCKHVVAYGMFNEELYGGIYEVEFKSDYYGMEVVNKVTYAEIVQAEPWSSGPVIFTCLIDLRNCERLGEWSEEDINNA